MATYTSNYGWTKPSGSDNVDISVLNGNLDDQDSTIHDAFLNMAPPFSESSTYAVDDIVLYTTGLYKCHTAVVTPGSWTGSTNWQVYKLSEGGSGGGGTSNYNDLTNKPSINGVTLLGNKTTSDLGLQSELTFDNVPTDGSNNPVKSDGIYDSEKDIYAVMGAMGAKNLIPYPYKQASGTVNRGITFTYDNRGVVTANNTSSATDQPFLILSFLDFLEKNKEFIISSGSSTLFCVIYFYNASSQPVNVTKTMIYDDGTEKTTTDSYISLLVSGTIHQWCKFKVTDGDFAFAAVQVRAQSGSITYNNEKIYPMLRLASDTDDTYQPYAKTNRELTESYPANKVMMSDGETSVEEKIGNLLNGAVFEPFQAPGTNPFAEGGSGYILKVKYNNTVIGYMAMRPKRYSTQSDRKVAIELYDASWGLIWEVHRDYPV
jgi:hypothetical protein